MIVEIFGHAGAGKSLLVRRLANRLEELGVRAIVLDARDTMKRRRWPGNRLFQAWCLLRSPGIAVRGLSLLGMDAVRQPRLLGTLGGLSCRARAIKEHGSEPSIVLVDEGVMHGAWSLTLTGRAVREETVAALLDRLPSVDFAISLRPPRQHIHGNLSKDSDSRLAVLDRAEVSRLLDKQDVLLDWLEERVERYGRLHRVGEPTEAVVRDLAARLAEDYRARHEDGEQLTHFSKPL